MSRPILTVVAGCNGSGKSTFSKTYVKNIIPFDFDKRFMQKYGAMQDSELRDLIAHNLTRTEFKKAIYEAFSKKKSFCYETNFDTNPMFWVEEARMLGYRIELIFYCLDSLETAKRRVLYRTNNEGHFVPDDTVEFKWKEGYKNLNLYFKMFDHVLLIDNSLETRKAQNICLLSKDNNELYEIHHYQDLPEYAERRFPNLYSLLKSK